MFSVKFKVSCKDFFSALQPTDQGEESVFLFLLLLGIWGDCFPISYVHSKWVHPEKTVLQNGCIQRKLFFKMGASRENCSSKWVHPEKTVL